MLHDLFLVYPAILRDVIDFKLDSLRKKIEISLINLFSRPEIVTNYVPFFKFSKPVFSHEFAI